MMAFKDESLKTWMGFVWCKGNNGRQQQSFKKQGL
jgi:hypothetical protein